MLKGEKIVREDGLFEIVIENNNNLILRSVNNGGINQSDQSAADTQVKRIIMTNVNSIWLHRFQVAVYKNDSSVHLLRNFYNKSPEYKLRIDLNSNQQIPNYMIDADEHIRKDYEDIQEDYENVLFT
jgi:hypothetical protein